MLIPILVIIAIIAILFLYRKTEMFSQGAWTQLVAKDAQDTYLTGDAWKYMYYPRYSPEYTYVYGYPPYDTNSYSYADPYVNPVILTAGYPFYSGMRLKKSQHPTL